MHVQLIALNQVYFAWGSKVIMCWHTEGSLFCMGFKGHHVLAYRGEPGAGGEANMRLQCTIFLVDTPSTYMYTRVIMTHVASCLS